jgi:hypothetical protein
VTTTDFYEDDEPAGNELATFDAGEKSTTRPPVRGGSPVPGRGQSSGQPVTTAAAPADVRPEPDDPIAASRGVFRDDGPPSDVLRREDRRLEVASEPSAGPGTEP